MRIKTYYMIVLIGILLSGCQRQQGEMQTESVFATQNQESFALSMMVTTHTGQPMQKSSPVYQAIEAYTQTEMDILWVPNNGYLDRLDITLASGQMPTIMLVQSKAASVINAARNGLFWDLTPYLEDYNHLSQADPQVLKNIAIDGKVYGIYRARQIGRNAISFRKDWLDNVGLKPPKTIEDFYEMLYAFTYKDPNQSGKQDTYGMVLTKWEGPLNIMQTWFGAPNGWGFDENGRLVPDFMTEAYREALLFFRKLYAEGLINPGFPLLESSNWYDDYLDEKAGVVVDVADFATSIQTKFEKQLGYEHQVWDVISTVKGPLGLRNLPFLGGYNGFFVITKSGAPTEKDLKKALLFLDQLNDYDMQIIMMYGIEGIHHGYDDEGYYQVYDDANLLADYYDAAQLGMGISGDFRYDPELPIKRDALTIKRDQVYLENLDLLVNNPCEAFISDTYANMGESLDRVIGNARIQFIAGLIDEDEFQMVIDQWYNAGGKDLMQEYQQLYDASNQEN